MLLELVAITTFAMRVTGASLFLIQAHVFRSKSGSCAAFLANYDQHSFATVSFANRHYNLPPWSISILPDCKNTVFNTARVSYAV